MRKIILFGDSLTERGWRVSERGWVAQLAELYGRRAEVVNLGHSGYVSRWALLIAKRLFSEQSPRLPLLPSSNGNRNVNADSDAADIPSTTTTTSISNSDEEEEKKMLEDRVARRPLLATVFFGANDAAMNEKQMTSIDDYERYMGELIDVIRSNDDDPAAVPERILVITPPPCDADAWNATRTSVPNINNNNNNNNNKGGVIDRTQERTTEFAKRCAELCVKKNVPCLDLHSKMYELGFDKWRQFLEQDGLHFSAMGNDFLYESVVAKINELWPEMTVSDDGSGLGFYLAHHSQVNFSNPEETFPFQ